MSTKAIQVVGIITAVDELMIGRFLEMRFYEIVTGDQTTPCFRNTFESQHGFHWQIDQDFLHCFFRNTINTSSGLDHSFRHSRIYQNVEILRECDLTYLCVQYRGGGGGEEEEDSVKN